MAGADISTFRSTNSSPGREIFAALAELYTDPGGPNRGSNPCVTDALVLNAIQEFGFECNRVIHRHDARIIEVCTALQDLHLPALQLCEIIQAVLWFWPRLKFHDIWNRVVLVRHFHDRRLH